jgi:type VI secretion system protein ImpL
LRWSRGEVVVALDLKITSSAETTGAGADTAVQEQGFRGMKLPETIVGGAPAPAIAVAAAGEAK